DLVAGQLVQLVRDRDLASVRSDAPQPGSLLTSLHALARPDTGRSPTTVALADLEAGNWRGSTALTIGLESSTALPGLGSRANGARVVSLLGGQRTKQSTATTPRASGPAAYPRGRYRV